MDASRLNQIECEHVAPGSILAGLKLRACRRLLLVLISGQFLFAIPDISAAQFTQPQFTQPSAQTSSFLPAAPQIPGATGEKDLQGADQASLFAEPVIIERTRNNDIRRGKAKIPAFSVSTRQQSATQEGETIVGEAIPETVEAELIDGSALFGPVDANNQPIETNNSGSGLPSLGDDAMLRGPGTPGSEFVPQSNYQGGGYTPSSSTQNTRETAGRLRSGDSLFPDPTATQPIERQADVTDGTHEVIRQNYPSGKTKIQRTVTQDETGDYYNDGKWILFNEQGQPITIGNYRRGAMHGMWLRRHEAGSGGIFAEIPFSQFQGPYKSQATFVQGKLDGQWVLSDREGRSMCEIPYTNGIRNGIAKWFYPSGSVMRQVRFEQGSPDGLLQQWDEQSKLQLQEEFANGRKIIRQRAFYPNKVKSKEEVFQDRKLVVDGPDDWWSASPAPFAASGERIQHGPTMSWYPNNQPKMRGNFENDQRSGTFTWWHSNGNKELEGRFAKGEKVGPWIWWYDSGIRKIQGTYVNDEPDGLWIWWDADGKVVDRKTFPLPDDEETSTEDSSSEDGSSVLDQSETDGEQSGDVLTSDPFNESADETSDDGNVSNDAVESEDRDPGGIWSINLDEEEDDGQEGIDVGAGAEEIFAEPVDETTGELPERLYQEYESSNNGQ